MFELEKNISYAVILQIC